MLGWKIIKVCGDSMSPHLPDQSYALFRRSRHLRVGDIVLVHHHRFGPIVKRVLVVHDDCVELEGTSPQSTSTADLGRVARHRVHGRLVKHVVPPSARDRQLES
ncbi:MAG: S24/S26 family peptidase [Pseudomonadota bacterium]